MSITSKAKGFTLIEVIVIICVIALLATVVIVAVGDWRKSTAETEVKNDLKNVVSAMDAARNFNNGYPTSIPSTFSASPNVTVTYEWGSSIDYCIEAVSKVIATVVYHSEAPDYKEPQSGAC